MDFCNWAYDLNYRQSVAIVSIALKTLHNSQNRCHTNIAASVGWHTSSSVKEKEIMISVAD